jgi:hypothetical protein
MATPFRVGEQVTGEFFTDRAEEVARILRAMREPSRLLVYGERRQGKSSAIRQAGVRFAADAGLLIWVDVATASGLDDLARRVVSSIPYRWVWREDLQTRLVKASLRIEARTDASGQPVLSLGLGPAGASSGRAELERAVRVLDDLAEERGLRVTIVLDEFQEVTEIAERGAWIIRDLMQTTHASSWICAGSRTALIHNLTGADGPFHRFFEPLNIREIDPGHLAAWIESRMEGAGLDAAEGTARAILKRVGPRTQDCLQLARTVYALRTPSGSAGPGDVERALLQSVLEDNDRFQTIWSALAPSQQAVLRAVAAGVKQLYSRGAALDYRLPTAGSIRKAVLALVDRGHLTTGDAVRIDDPFFREWILLRAMPDGAPHGELAR